MTDLKFKFKFKFMQKGKALFPNPKSEEALQGSPAEHASSQGVVAVAGEAMRGKSVPESADLGLPGAAQAARGIEHPMGLYVVHVV